jgi:hypothetical protein
VPDFRSVVLIPATGAATLRQAVQSVNTQGAPTRAYVVCDGQAHQQAVQAQLQGLQATLCVLPLNVGAGGFYGHRVYAAFAHLVLEDHVLFLDQDNWFEPDHVERCLARMTQRGLHWGWGQDRVFSQTLMQHVPSFDCTRAYGLNYRLGSTPDSVNEDFFRQGNRQMRARLDKRLPWQEVG